MLEHARKVSIRETFEIKIAESSLTARNLWENSSLEIAKMEAISSKQNYTVLSKPIGWNKAGVKFKNKVLSYNRYRLCNTNSFLSSIFCVANTTLVGFA